MRSKVKTILLAVALLSAYLLAGCQSDDPATIVQWDLSIQNNTANVYDVYQDTDLVGHEFTNVGQVGAQSSITLRGLIDSVGYTFRLVTVGEDLDNFDHETTLSSNGDNMTWVVP